MAEEQFEVGRRRCHALRRDHGPVGKGDWLLFEPDDIRRGPIHTETRGQWRHQMYIWLLAREAVQACTALFLYSNFLLIDLILKLPEASTYTDRTNRQIRHSDPTQQSVSRVPASNWKNANEKGKWSPSSTWHQFRILNFSLTSSEPQEWRTVVRENVDIEKRFDESTVSSYGPNIGLIKFFS